MLLVEDANHLSIEIWNEPNGKVELFHVSSRLFVQTFDQDRRYGMVLRMLRGFLD